MTPKPRVAGPDVIAYAEAHQVDLTQVVASALTGVISLDDVKASRPMPSVSDSVQAFAQEHRVDLRDARGTGKDGTVTKFDVAKVATSASGDATLEVKTFLEDLRESGLTPTAGLRSFEDRQYQASQARARISAYAPNPLAEQVRADATAGLTRMPQGSTPSLFASGDLPAFTASGIAPEALLQVPWTARHAMAAAPTAADAYAIQSACAGVGGDDAAADLGDLEMHPGNADYRQRMQAWVDSAVTEEDIEAAWARTPLGAQVLAAEEATRAAHNGAR